MSAVLERTTFSTPRALDYFSAVELERQTGQPRSRFSAVVLKELIDNALDACEAAGVAPKVRVAVERRGDDLRITVEDNGPGLPADVLARILDFSTVTSDKAAYRSPTRGAQGNALKTVLGIPYALAGEAAALIVVEACGVRHTIRPWITPAGEVRIPCEQEPVALHPGTRIAVTLPATGQEDRTQYLMIGYRAFNPHADIRRVRAVYWRGRFVRSAPAHRRVQQAESTRKGTVTSYKPDPGWRKWRPSDPTAAAWYTMADLERLIFSYIAAARAGGRDLPLGEFVRKFAGLSGTAKAKTITARVPEVRRLSDFEDRRALIAPLLAAMQRCSRPPKPEALGALGADRIFGRMAAFWKLEAGRCWYRKAVGTTADGNVPFIVEAAVAEVGGHGLLTGLNFAPTFGDPFADVAFAWTDGRGEEHQARGLWDLLGELHCAPGEARGCHVAVAVHLACPALDFTDKGKTHVALPDEIAHSVCTAVRGACREHERLVRMEEKDAERAARERIRLTRGSTRDPDMRQAVFDVLPEAVRRASGGGAYPFSARSLYYQVRPLLQGHTSKDLDYSYFTPPLLTEYQERNGAIPGLYYDPRGYLLEPHTGKMVPLGTRDVEAYRLPEWCFNKVLYVEKKGLLPVLQAAQLAERYDMAIVAAEGYASRAAKALLAAAEGTGAVTVLVLHDADVDGYNISRTLREATRTSPHAVQVVDLGLTVADALAAGLQPERVLRKKDLPAELAHGLSAKEREFFAARHLGGHRWEGRRVELNAFASDALVEYVEEKLRAEGLTAKVLPPREVVAAKAREALAAEVHEMVTAEVARLLDLDRLAARLGDQQAARLNTGALHAMLRNALQDNPPEPWDHLTAQAAVATADLPAVRAAVEQALRPPQTP